MKKTHLITVLVCIVAVGIFTADVSAYYHPGMGRFLTRDPGAGNATRIGSRGGPAVAGGFISRDPASSNQYADGMNLYQYVASDPGGNVDPQGTVIVSLTGLKIFGFGGKRSDLDLAIASIENRIAPLLRQYQADDSKGIEFLERKRANGGSGGPDFIREQYTAFVKRKTEEDVCSLEQFIVIGHSDGATAIRIASPSLNDAKWVPAYYGLVDLVRLTFTDLIGNKKKGAKTDIKANSDASLRSARNRRLRRFFNVNKGLTWQNLHKNGLLATSEGGVNSMTVIQNFRQTTGTPFGWRGHIVSGAQDDIAFDDVSHRKIPRDHRVWTKIGARAARAYLDGIKRDIAANGRPRKWPLKPGTGPRVKW